MLKVRDEKLKNDMLLPLHLHAVISFTVMVAIGNPSLTDQSDIDPVAIGNPSLTGQSDRSGPTINGTLFYKDLREFCGSAFPYHLIDNIKNIFG